MKLRRRAFPLLLLLPTFANSIALNSGSEPARVVHLPRDVPEDEDAAISNTPLHAAFSKADVGTKDAPVDGLDGKPHKGPWVESGQKSPDTAGDDVPASQKSTAASDRPKGVASSVAQKILEPHDGVMDDPNRVTPRKGTTGTEGGITEKEKEKGGLERSPESPKGPRPLPDGDEGFKVNPVTGERMNEPEKVKGALGLENPSGLPNTPHDIPHPPPSGAKDDLYDHKPVLPDPDIIDDDDEDGGVIQPFHSFILSFAMILFSEVGDKTFLVAALMAMRHPRMVVFSAAFSALVAMTVLSAVLGHAVPALLSVRVTSFLAALLFFVFGVRLLREGYRMSPDEGVGEEMKEVEMELEEKEHLAMKSGRRRSSLTPYTLEAGRGRRSRSNSRLPAPPRSPSSSPSRSPSPNRSSLSSILSGLNNLLSLLLSPAWVQTFIMTFLGEWGDRSQIATIAMAAGQDYWWVTCGAATGHGMCTAAAVIGGRAIAGRVSMRKVTLGGAFAFLIFGLIYLIEAIHLDS